MRASEVRVPKTFRIKQETLEAIEVLQKNAGLSQGKVIDLAIELLKRDRKLV